MHGPDVLHPIADLADLRGPLGRGDVLREECPLRMTVDRLGDAWSVLVILHLSAGPMRFNALRRALEGVSQRMLTVTLRGLERDGFVGRTVFPTVPPQVEYALTDLGRSLAGLIGGVNAWAVANIPAVRDNRRAFDGEGRDAAE